MQSYRRGVIYAVLAGVFLSSSGLLVRNIEQASAWTVLFYRSLAFSVTVFGFILYRAGQQSRPWLDDFRRLRIGDTVVSVMLAVGFIFYLLSLFHTTVANTVLLLSTGPFFAAVLGWLLLREAVHAVTWIAMTIAAVGVYMIVSEGIAGGQLTGMVYAVLVVASSAVMVVWLRRAGDRDMLAATCLAGVIAAAISYPFVPGLAIGVQDLVLSLLLGSIQIGIGFILITLAANSVPAAQVSLLALTETALAPLWVWIFVGETPARNTLLGGFIVLAAVVLQGVAGLRVRGASPPSAVPHSDNSQVVDSSAGTGPNTGKQR